MTDQRFNCPAQDGFSAQHTKLLGNAAAHA
jgi:hypothetical protein